MKPVEHPDFFRGLGPTGSRESDIVLDRDGRFWHEGEPVANAAVARALHRWIDRHPDNDRLILNSGFDWCYFRVEDTPYVVRRLTPRPDGEVELELSDGSRELLDPCSLCVGGDDALYAAVKRGRFEARFSRAAQADLAPLVRDAEPPAIEVAGVVHAIGERDEPREA